jgi:hypothetical protein
MGRMINSIKKQLDRDGIVSLGQPGNISIWEKGGYYYVSGHGKQGIFTNKTMAIKDAIKEDSKQ